MRGRIICGAKAVGRLCTLLGLLSLLMVPALAPISAQTGGTDDDYLLPARLLFQRPRVNRDHILQPYEHLG